MLMMLIPHQITVIVSFTSLLSLFVFTYLDNSFYWLLFSYLYCKIVIGMLGNQIAQHRYFAHNSFKTTKTKEIFLYCLGLTTSVSPIFYALSHRQHHLNSDGKLDRHSPHNKWYDVLSPITIKTSGDRSIPSDSAKLLITRMWYIHKWRNHILITYYLISLLISWKFLVFVVWAGIAWNLIHMVLFRTWLVHVKLPGSYRNFETSDKSWNNKIIQIFDWGEGLHNNHHEYPNKYNQAMKPGEFDPVGWVVMKFFAKG